MSATEKPFPLSLFLYLFTLTLFTTPSTSAPETFIFGGCSQQKCIPNSPYESNLNSLLTSLVNSAMFTSYNNFTIVGSTQQDTVYGLFQCRGDLDTSTCARCVAHSISQLGTLCLDSCGGVLQLEGCFVKFDNTSFLGVEDKTLVVQKCGPSIGYDSDALTRRDAALGYLGESDGSYKTYKVSGSGNMQAVAQCVGDLSVSECGDCLAEAIGRLKTECGGASWGDVFLAKCYARYSEGGTHSHGGNDTNNNDTEIEKTLAIIIGLIVIVAIIIIFFSIVSRYLDKSRKGGK